MFLWQNALDLGIIIVHANMGIGAWETNNAWAEVDDVMLHINEIFMSHSHTDQTSRKLIEPHGTWCEGIEKNLQS